MRIVAALGGNALLRRHEAPDIAVQRAHVKEAVAALVGIGRDHELIVTHGNGPQVGLLALMAEAYRDVPAYPLDVLGAESQGMIGYLLGQELASALPGREVVTVLTQVEVDHADAAFTHPTKPIGPIYDQVTAGNLASARGWVLGPDGDGCRRLVPSPEPKRIVELATIGLLVASGVLVICAGGGGIPVVVDDAGSLRGVEAVVDKDLSTALLAVGLNADALLLLTDTDAVYTDWGTPQARPLAETNPRELRRIDLVTGSMGPKAEAAARFVEATNGIAAIGRVAEAGAVLAGSAGTSIRSGFSLLRWRTAGGGQTLRNESA